MSWLMIPKWFTEIQEPVELGREQAVLAEDPQTLSQRIDQVTTTLGSTAQWVNDRQTIYGAVEDLMSEAQAVKLTIDERSGARYESNRQS